MDKIEQARESLTQKIRGRLEKWVQSMDYDSRELVAKVIEFALDASLSPFTPVDGVVAEPVAYIEREALAELLKHKTAQATVASGLLRKPWGDNVALYAAPLASPEAEARLRERVAEVAGYQQLKEGKWVGCSEFVAKGWSDKISEGCRAVYTLEAAEARLAQAKGGPAVTEARANISDEELAQWASRRADDAGRLARELIAYRRGLHGPFGWLNGCRELSEDSWTLEADPVEHGDEYFAIPLYALTDPFKEAALHPQSAAGEEGK